jgi:hypothetical protein
LCYNTFLLFEYVSLKPVNAMKNLLLKLFSTVFILALTSCASVKFYSDATMTKKSGLKYYSVKPYLQVERDLSNNTILKTTIVYLPDLENPQYIALKDGLGSKKFDLKLTEGSISTFSLDSDAQIAENVAALSGMISKTATAVTDLATLKGFPSSAASSTTLELYDISISEGITSVRKIEIK